MLGGSTLRTSRNNKIYYEQKPDPRIFRLSIHLDQEAMKYLDYNQISFNQLCRFAIEDFISKAQSLSLIPIKEIEKNKNLSKNQEKRVNSFIRKSPSRSARLTKDLDLEVQEYLDRNDLSFGQLCQFAIEQFIIEGHSFELAPVGSPSKVLRIRPPLLEKENTNF